jgi:hypothetical protein
MDPEFIELIQKAVSDGISTTQIMPGIIALVAAGIGAWVGSYASKRAEFAALKDDFQESLKQLREQTRVIEETKAEVEGLRGDEKLALELQKTRGVERQELRYKSYSLLWKELRPLAIYDETVINKEVVGKLSRCLSDWYFSENGGLLLTPHVRDFYFALQDLLQATSNVKYEWKTDRSEASAGGEKQIFKDVLIRYADDVREESDIMPSTVLQYFTEAIFEDWQEKAPAKGRAWRKGIKDVAKEWDKLSGEQRFATLQQVGSILRTSLTNDLESRLR